MIISWLKDRRVHVAFGERHQKFFYINTGLPQGSSLNLYPIIVLRCDLVQYIGAHSGHLFADDLCVFVRSPIATKLASMIEYLTWSFAFL